jgi:ADP-heptose:LPS heptosyltransferase
MLKRMCRPVYFALRALLLSPFNRNRAADATLPERPRILLIRLDRVGDLVLSTPVLKVLRKKYPAAHIAMLTRAAAADIVRHNPNLDELIVYRGFLASAISLRKRFDLVIDLLMDYNLDSALLTALLAPRRSIGFDIEGRGRLFTMPVRPAPERRHIIDHHLDLLRPLGCAAETEDDRRPGITVDPATRDAADAWLKERGIGPQHLLIALHPGGYYPSQRWPARHFSTLIGLLAARYPQARFLLLGGTSDAALLSGIRAALDEDVRANAIAVSGISLISLAAFIAMSKLFIGNNSGPVHIATAVGTPTLSTIGPAIPWMWRPYGAPDRNVVMSRELACSACGKGVCATHECMELITPGDMFREAERLIENR